MSKLPPYVSTYERLWHYGFQLLCGLIFFFLIFPLIVVIPLSFNVVPYFTFTKEMLALDPAGYSLTWYEDFFSNRNWQGAVRNSVIIAVFATLLSTTLGTLAGLGLSRPKMPAKTLVEMASEIRGYWGARPRTELLMMTNDDNAAIVAP